MAIYPWQAGLWQRIAAQPERLSHALLLEGPRGIGKREFALALAAARLCEHVQSDGQACGQCSACHWFAQGAHPDFRLIEPLADQDAAEEGGPRKLREIAIAQIRELADFVNLSAHRAGGRVLVIHPAEALNAAAANALLKTLEEPNPNSFFLLVTHQPHALLPTIKSRCLRQPMPQATAAQATAWLAGQGVAQAELCLALAGGAPLLAQEFSDADYLAAREQFLRALQQPQGMNWLHLAEQGAKSDLAARIDWLQRWLMDLLGARLAGRVRFNPDFVPGLQELAQRINVMRVQRFSGELAQIKRRLKHPLNPQLLLESVLLGYLAAVN